MKGFDKIDRKRLYGLIDDYASNWGRLPKREFEARLKSNISRNCWMIMG